MDAYYINYKNNVVGLGISYLTTHELRLFSKKQISDQKHNKLK